MSSPSSRRGSCDSSGALNPAPSGSTVRAPCNTVDSRTRRSSTMKAWTTPLALALCLASASSYAADPNLGRWKLNEAKSKMPKATQKNTRVIYETASGDRLKATVDGVDKDGKPIHNEWMGKADGKDYVVIGDPTTDTRSLTKVDDLHYTVVSKKKG